jgi:hypothetical protein
VRACSIVGNPMICGSNGSAGGCAAAVAPVAVPFPLESTPDSSEHSFPFHHSDPCLVAFSFVLCLLLYRSACGMAWHACVAAGSPFAV